MKPRIGVIPGDPSGIGPELVARLLSEPETREQADVLLIGDRCVFELGQEQVAKSFELRQCDARKDDWRQGGHFAWHELVTITAEKIQVATVTEASGRSVLRTLDLALDFVTDGIIDGILFTPFNKAALHLAGLGHDDELHYMAERLGVRTYFSELNTLDGIWTSRVTSHVALRDVPDMITEERICEAVRLIDTTLRRSGITQPRISVAALNPHGGDGGNFGREEIDIVAPAVEKVAASGINVDGPWPSDTVFLKAKAREVDAVVTLYHDQGQIALKLMGFDRGVTVQGGMPFPIATPAHGTAFDIAGKGVADVGATRAALGVACAMVSHWG